MCENGQFSQNFIEFLPRTFDQMPTVTPYTKSYHANQVASKTLDFTHPFPPAMNIQCFTWFCMVLQCFATSTCLPKISQPLSHLFLSNAFARFAATSGHGHAHSLFQDFACQYQGYFVYNKIYQNNSKYIIDILHVSSFCILWIAFVCFCIDSTGVALNSASYKLCL